MDQVQEVQSEQEIVDRIQGIVQPEKPRDPAGRFTKAAEEAPADEVTQEHEATQEQPTENTQTEGGDVQEAAPEEYKWDEIKDIKLKVPMKDGGREWEEELSLEDLRAQRMMQQDYQRKTQEVSQQRRQAEDAARQAVQQAQTQLAQELQVIEQVILTSLAPELQGKDLYRLSREDPAEWARLSQLQQTINQSVQWARQQFQHIQQQQQAQHQQIRAQATQQAMEAVQRDIPNWSSDLDRKLSEMAVKDYGVRPEHIANGFVPLADAGVIKLVHDAYQWRQLQAQKPGVTKKVAMAPKVLKPGAKTSQTQQNAAHIDKLRERVKATGGRDEKATVELLKLKMRGR